MGFGRITISQPVVILPQPPGFLLCARCCVRPTSSAVRDSLHLGEDTLVRKADITETPPEKPSTPPGAPGGMAPADKSCIFETKAGASLLAERPLTLFSACPRESCRDSLQREHRPSSLRVLKAPLPLEAAFQTRQAKDFNRRFKRTRDQKQMLLEDTSACRAVWGHGYGGEDDSSRTMQAPVQ